MADITFHSKDGLCPYFICNGLKFFIQDEKDYSGNWVYNLQVKQIESETINFYNEKQVELYLKENHARLINYFQKKSLYENSARSFVVKGNQVIKLGFIKQLTLNYDSYSECLKDAKEYIQENYFDKQLSLF